MYQNPAWRGFQGTPKFAPEEKMKARFLMALGIATLCLGCMALAGASQITVNFDNMSVGCCLGNNTLQNELGSWLTFGVMRINGGMVMADPHATTAPNVYEAFSVVPLASNNLPTNGSAPSPIEMMFSSPVSDIGFDVINGGAASTFTAYAFGSHGNPLGTETFSLNCGSCTGAVEHVSFDIGGISQVVVRSVVSAANFTDFAVDTVSFSTVPEPGSLALLGSGIVALWSQRKRIVNR
jgi:hypothetical protein